MARPDYASIIDRHAGNAEKLAGTLATPVVDATDASRLDGHARIVRVKDKVCVIDLGSKEGVHVPLTGGTVRRLRPHEPTDLAESGFHFLIGPIRLELEILGAS